jgi:hypothetical protein
LVSTVSESGRGLTLAKHGENVRSLRAPGPNTPFEKFERMVGFGDLREVGSRPRAAWAREHGADRRFSMPKLCIDDDFASERQPSVTQSSYPESTVRFAECATHAPANNPIVTEDARIVMQLDQKKTSGSQNSGNRCKCGRGVLLCDQRIEGRTETDDKIERWCEAKTSHVNLVKIDGYMLSARHTSTGPEHIGVGVDSVGCEASSSKFAQFAACAAADVEQVPRLWNPVPSGIRE